MQVTLSDILSCTAVAEDDRFGITALLHDPDTLKVRFVALDIGGWLQRHEVLVAIGRMGVLNIDEGFWATRLTRDEVEAAPRWSHHEPPADLSFWPPLIVGPFGETYSPLLMQAALAQGDDPARSAEEAVRQGSAEGPAGKDDPAFHLALTGDMRGREAFAEDGTVGRIEDVVLRQDPLRVHAVVIETDEGDRVTAPLSRLRHLAEQGHLVFDMPRSEFGAYQRA